MVLQTRNVLSWKLCEAWLGVNTESSRSHCAVARGQRCAILIEVVENLN